MKNGDGIYVAKFACFIISNIKKYIDTITLQLQLIEPIKSGSITHQHHTPHTLVINYIINRIMQEVL